MLQMQYLKMWTRDTFGELLKQRRHDLLELGRFNNIKYLLELVQVHHLSGSETNSTPNVMASETFKTEMDFANYLRTLPILNTVTKQLHWRSMSASWLYIILLVSVVSSSSAVLLVENKVV